MNQQAMLRKVQQMQKDMMKTQEEIENTEFKSTCGPVTVTMMGNKSLKQIDFEEEFEATSKEDLEMLGDMIVAASRQVTEEIEKFTEEKMAKYQALLGGFRM